VVTILTVKIPDVIQKPIRRASAIGFDVKGDFDAIAFGYVKEDLYSLVLA